MFATISFSRKNPLRSLPQTLKSITQWLSPLDSYHSPLKLPANPSCVLPILQFPPISILCSPFSQTPSLQKKEDSYNDASLFNRDPRSPPKLFVVQPRLRPDTLLHAKLDEALNLANSLEEQRDGYYDTEFCEKGLPPHVVVQNPAIRSSKYRSDIYFGPGTVDAIKCHLNAVESKGEIDAVYVNTILSGIQQRNLERAWGKPVLDRVGLIIEIFHAHAQTKEAKLQAELAALMYKRTRLVRVRGPDGRHSFGAAGEAEVVSARGRGSGKHGGRGFISGAGETELQLQRRRILERRSHLLSQIESVRHTRAVQRAARKRHGGSDGQGLATVAFVGYTNVGKSTLVSALSETYLYSDDRLFATVDPRLRSVILPSGRKVLLSDTVGFISDLPVQLVEAFHATLEEVVEADLLVHVLDSSAPDLDEQRSIVLKVLQQIGVSDEKLQNMIEVWNKIDLLEEEMGADEFLGDGEDDMEDGLSGAEDDMQSELSEKPAVDDDDEEEEDDDDDDDDEEEEEDDDDDIVSELASGDDRETMDDHEGDYSDGWLSAVGEENEYNQGSATSLNAIDDRQPEMTEKESCSQPQCVAHVKTSAAMGVGLQELLALIDEKLQTEKAQERNEFDCKWRPPRAEDAGTAVDQ